MAAASSQAPKRALDLDSHQRRKVRKGTQSCWECKRRKIKCQFTSAEGPICEPCAQRGTQCVSQDLPDPGSSHTEDRISRIETLLENVLTKLDHGAVQHSGHQKPRLSSSQSGSRSVQSLAGHDSSNVPFSQEPNSQEARSPSDEAREEPLDLYTQLAPALLAALPSGTDLDIILGLATEIPPSIADLPCLHSSKHSPGHTGLETLYSLIQKPGLVCLPITAARSLLLLGSVLQNLPCAATDLLEETGIDYRHTESHGVAIARQLVLCHDELVQSLDGIQCLAIESMFHNSYGELRRAWLTLQRAIAIAKLLGLERKAKQSYPGGRDDAELLWTFLIRADCYLSLTLGLPKGIPNDSILISPDIAAALAPVERMQRLHCLATNKIIQRRDLRTGDASLTEAVDGLLQDAAATMPARWWLPPATFEKDPHNSMLSQDEKRRLMDQMVHSHLVIRLYLPYLLGGTENVPYDDYRMTTTTASRDVLIRYIAFRALCGTNNYCRGIDFLMFIAVATLCISHIDSHCQRQLSVHPTYHHLAHQRLGDRGLMERILEIVEQTTRIGKDELNSNISKTIRHLLSYEADATDGRMIKISSPLEDDAVEDDCSSTKCNDTLKFSIPWIGRINIRHQHEEGNQVEQFPLNHDLDPDIQQWPLQGVDVALFDDLFQGLGVDYTAL